MLLSVSWAHSSHSNWCFFSKCASISRLLEPTWLPTKEFREVAAWLLQFLKPEKPLVELLVLQNLQFTWKISVPQAVRTWPRLACALKLKRLKVKLNIKKCQNDMEVADEIQIKHLIFAPVDWTFLRWSVALGAGKWKKTQANWIMHGQKEKCQPLTLRTPRVSSINWLILSSSLLHGSTDCIISSTTPPSSIISPTHMFRNWSMSKSSKSMSPDLSYFKRFLSSDRIEYASVIFWKIGFASDEGFLSGWYLKDFWR